MRGLESGRIGLKPADSLGTWELIAKVTGQHGCPCAEIYSKEYLGYGGFCLNQPNRIPVAGGPGRSGLPWGVEGHEPEQILRVGGSG